MLEENVPTFAAVMCYMQFYVYLMFGHLRDFFSAIFSALHLIKPEAPPGYAPITKGFERFYVRHIYRRLCDSFFVPVASAPGAHIDIIQRVSYDHNRTFVKLDAPPKRCINHGSYNYLGFADDWMSTCSKDVFHAIDTLPVASTSSPMEFGTTTVHAELEAMLAEFIGKPAALVYNMGYGTNASTIPALMGKGTLVLSDAFNHTSIVNGSRASGATIGVFRHNDMKHLEKLLREKISEGQPRTHRPWKKVWIFVEGIYSMEGEIVDLRAVVNLAKKYKAYVYVDEAHSIGALGKTGRGVCEYTGVDPSEVDILMGTFSKCVGGMGGYITGSQEIIDHVRSSSLGTRYTMGLSPTVAQQILTAFKIIAGKDGTNLGRQKLDALRDNNNYFRQKLIDMGLITLGHFDSPVIPVMLFHLSKVREFQIECLKRNLVAVTVGFPATPLLLGRVRFCISAAHTRKDMDEALEIVKEVSDLCAVRFLKNEVKHKKVV
uniref:Aminotransferase class I/classII large domain-containing protein n=1 Tax=Globisporangium ultimum (strain ATCC 200006 / CBS 805.95 / DAOM BR144) TaxID=431595 RepID=K3X408_GLOUD